ncbi:hypothetical protein N9Q60_00580 [Flavobacteriaceae bacterium]|nr:hypothetical protein [Flavobacteriaceae bacterium]
MTIKRSLLFIVLVTASLSAQTNDQYYANEEYVEEEYFEPLNDKSSEGQMIFVEELLDLAGYIIETIEVYQTLPNSARIYRVKYNENTQGGFIFIRWDKKKKENYIANKMIDPGVYYNLNTAREIMRNQTNKESFSVEDIALQAPDQETISTDDIEGLRQAYDLEQEEKKLKEIERLNKTKKKRRKRKN